MEIFIAAAEHGSFSAAARALGRSVSGVSMSISNLEDDLAIELFDRSRKLPTLTSGGQRLVAHAKTLLRQAHRLDSVIQDINDTVEDEVAIGIGELVPISLIEEHIAKTIRKFPNTQFSVVRAGRDELEKKFESGNLQVLIRSQSAAVDTESDFFTFAIAEYICVCSPDAELADMENISNEALISTRQVISSSMLENEMLSVEAKISNEILPVSSTDDLVKFVEQDLGWAFISKEDAEIHIEQGSLQQFSPEFAITMRGLPLDFLVKPQSELGPVLRFLKDCFTNSNTYLNNTYSQNVK